MRYQTVQVSYVGLIPPKEKIIDEFKLLDCYPGDSLNYVVCFEFPASYKKRIDKEVFRRGEFLKDLKHYREHVGSILRPWGLNAAICNQAGIEHGNWAYYHVQCPHRPFKYRHYGFFVKEKVKYLLFINCSSSDIFFMVDVFDNLYAVVKASKADYHKMTLEEFVDSPYWDDFHRRHSYMNKRQFRRYWMSK